VRWLDEFFPNDKKIIWNYETCKEESKKYLTRCEMKFKCYSAYKLCCKNGWIDEFFPKNEETS
jgi:hypothetical protein